MLYTKLFEIGKIGLNAQNIGLLLEKFQSLGGNAVVTESEILKAIRQKTLIDKVIIFLIENCILEEIESDDDNQRFFRLIVGFPKSVDEKAAEKYTSTKLFRAKKELLAKKIESYAKQKKDGWIVLIDFANSTKMQSVDPFLRDDVLNKVLPNLIKATEEKYFSQLDGYMIKQEGDGFYFYFFTQDKAFGFIDSMLKNAQKDLFLLFSEYNKNLNSKIPFAENAYLKIFVANSATTQLSISYDFNNMLAFTYLNRVEKTFKKTLIDNGQKQIATHFIVSKEKIDGYEKIILVTENGPKDAYYKIF